MKLVIIILFISLMQVCAAGFAQKVTLNEKDASLESVISKIRNQTGYDFVFDFRLLEKAGKVNVKVKNADLDAALKIVFKNQALDYTIKDKIIVIDEKEKGVVEKITKFIKAIKITGIVTDEKGKLLAGVSVKIKGTGKATITDREGSFTIEVKDENAVLLFSFVGYKTVEQVVKGNTSLAIILEAGISQLNEVGIVSTGYQQLPKERATGSFVQISSELLNRKVSTNILERLDGVSAGVFFNGTGTFNGTTTTNLATVSNNRNYGITIRGQNSFSITTAQPLIVVDNFPYEGEPSNINPNDIESITILKDAAAASIWGARSGNGVIVITTKKGAKNQKMKVEVNSNVTVIDKPDLFYSKDFLNSASYIEVEKYLFDAGFFNSDITNTSARPAISPAVEIFSREKAGSISAAEAASQLDVLRSKDVRNDYDRYFYRKAINQQYSIGIRGGGENLEYALSAGYDNNLNTLVENSYNRITLNSSNTYTPIKNLNISASINYSQSKTIENNDFGFKQYTGTGNLKYTYLYPYATLADAAGNALAVENGIRMSYLDEMEAKGFLDWHYRPLDDIKSNDNSTRINDLLLRLSAKYKILAQLSAELLYQSERQIIDRNNFKAQDTYYARNLINRYSALNAATGKVSYIFPLGGILNQGKYDWNADNFRVQLNYNQTAGNHEISAIAGAEIRELNSEGYSRLSYGYDDQFGTSVSTLDFLTNYPINPSGTARIPNLSSDVTGFTNRYLSYFANAGYTYNDRYTFTISGRKDGANLFGVQTNDRITPLWSAGIGWDISKESFYNSSLLPYLRFRASYGFNGNINRNGTSFLTGSYTTDQITGAKIINGATAPNPELRWEKIKNINIGFDFRSKNNVFTGTIEGFYKRGFDLFQATALAPQTGFTSYTANAANSRATGIDISLQSENLKGIFSWTSSLLLSTLKDKVVKYDPPLTANSISTVGLVVGYSMFSTFSYKWAGLNPDNGNPRGYLNGVVSEDYTAIRNKYSPENLVYEGSVRPTVFGALRNDFSFKEFTLSLNITYKLGYVFRPSMVTLNYRDILTTKQNQDYDKRWQKPGDELTTQVPSLAYPSNSDRNTFYQNSEATIEDGDHIRLQDIRLAYSFPKYILSKTKIQSLQLYAYSNNMGIIWRKNKIGIDPDAGIFPNPFSISFGLSANF